MRENKEDREKERKKMRKRRKMRKKITRRMNSSKLVLGSQLKGITNPEFMMKRCSAE